MSKDIHKTATGAELLALCDPATKYRTDRDAGTVTVSVTLPDGTERTTQGAEYRLAIIKMATLLGVSYDFLSLRL
jgi:hypothetical protein